MHILHILEATAGGTRRHVLDLLPALTRRGVRCTLIYSPLRHPQFEQDAALLKEHNITAIPVPMTRGWNAAIDIPALQTIRSLIGKSTFDIIHAHSSKAGLLGRLAAGPRRRNAVVYTPHCISLNARLSRRERRLARLAETMLAPLTGQFIAVSLQEKQTILRARLGAPGRVHLIYNGIDAENMPCPLPLSVDAFRMGCFGRLSHQKNQQFAIRLLRHLQDQKNHHQRIELHLVGDGEDRNLLQALARQLRVEDHIIWHNGFTDPFHLYAQCDVIVQPSRWEGCPYSVLEAMAAKRPVLASPAGAMPQLLAGCGQVAKLSRPDLWQRTLSGWQQDPECREHLGTLAREKIQKYFSLETMVGATVKVYEDTLC